MNGKPTAQRGLEMLAGTIFQKELQTLLFKK